MTGRRKFSDLVNKLPAERQARIGKIAAGLREEMDLAQLRMARQLSQAALGEILHVEQPAIAKIEKRADMYVSTLRRFIEAMGGALEITARFPDRNVVIRNFHDLGIGDSGLAKEPPVKAS
jgi:transcriptional regulator with XRE-family HTH domain